MKKKQPAGVGMTPSKTELGSFVRARRIELDLRQVPLAKQSGLAHSQISQIEVGVKKYLDDNQLTQLATALKCDTEELRKRMPVKPGSHPTTELGKLIRSRREELGMTIESFAKKMKMTPQRARHLEIRKNPSIRYNTLNPLAKVLDLDPVILSKFVGTTRKESTSELGNLVRSRRKELGMSIGDLAEKLDVSRQFANQIEFGQARLSTNDEMIVKLAEVLQLDVEKLEAVRPERRLKTVENPSTGLGGFLAAKRLELHLTQREVGERAEVGTTVVSALENGRLRATPNVLEKLQKALDCQIPPELIPPPHVRQNGHYKDVGFTIAREGLGKFVTERRIELKLSQAQFAQQAGTGTAVISGIERGTYRPGEGMVARLSKALGCEIPAELIPTPRRSGPRGPRTEQEGFSSSVMVHLSDQNLADLDRIKELSDIRVNTEAVRKALKILRLLLEKQKDGSAVCLRKGDNIVELEFLF